MQQNLRKEANQTAHDRMIAEKRRCHKYQEKGYWKGREDLTEIIIIMAVSTNMNNVLDG